MHYTNVLESKDSLTEGQKHFIKLIIMHSFLKITSPTELTFIDNNTSLTVSTVCTLILIERHTTSKEHLFLLSKQLKKGSITTKP